MVTVESTATSFLRGYLARLAHRGFDVTLVATDEGRLKEFARQHGVRAAPVSMRRDPDPAADLRSLVALARILRRRRPEIVVTATPKASLLGMLAATLTGVPVRVYQVWGLRCETETGPRHWLLARLERATLLLSTHIVANSPSLAAEIRRLVPGRHVAVVGEGSSHGVDLARFSRAAAMPPLPAAAREAISGHGIVVGSIGRVHRDKGTLVLLDAMRAIAAERPATLLVVGSSEDEATERELSRDLAPLRVVRVSAVDDPRPWFTAMDVHVLPTLREGFPNVVLEATALEVPTITTTATGARDSVIDGVTGLLVRPSDAAALRHAILRLLDDEALRRRCTAAARQRVEQHFSNEHIWDLQIAYLEAARGDQDSEVRKPSRPRRWSARRLLPAHG
jgi:glycosyltransferase involved in cell wall biosynthesis